MKLDLAGYNFIKSVEGFREAPYQDSAGVWTIGYGHTDGVCQYTPVITEMQGQAFLQDDIEPIERAISNAMKVPLSQSEFDALVSFAFNEGTMKLLNSTLFQKLNSGDKQGAAKEFDRWVYFQNPETGQMQVSNGLVERRKKEKALFLSDFNSQRSTATEI